MTKGWCIRHPIFSLCMYSLHIFQMAVLLPYSYLFIEIDGQALAKNRSSISSLYNGFLPTSATKPPLLIHSGEPFDLVVLHCPEVDNAG